MSETICVPESLRCSGESLENGPHFGAQTLSQTPPLSRVKPGYRIWDLGSQIRELGAGIWDLGIWDLGIWGWGVGTCAGEGAHGLHEASVSLVGDGPRSLQLRGAGLGVFARVPPRGAMSCRGLLAPTAAFQEPCVESPLLRAVAPTRQAVTACCGGSGGRPARA